MHDARADVEDALGKGRGGSIQRFYHGLCDIFDVCIVAAHVAACSETGRQFAQTILHHGFDVHGVAHTIAIDGRVA